MVRVRSTGASGKSCLVTPAVIFADDSCSIRNASAALSSLEQKWGADVYNNYLARPDVEYYRKQLNEELNSLK